MPAICRILSVWQFFSTKDSPCRYLKPNRPSEFTTSAVLTAYKALPESLRPFYAHIHCGSAAIVAALGLTAEDNNVLETAVKAIGDLADDAEAFDRDAPPRAEPSQT